MPESGDAFMISGFEKSFMKGKRKRRKMNPQRGDNLNFRASKGFTFKCSEVIRDQVKGNG